MTDEYEARLIDIRGGPWRGQSTLARQKLRSMTEADAYRYLRDHREDVVRDTDEIAFRESFDQALEELQILELAICSGYLPVEVVKEHAADEFKELLSHSAARQYLKIYDYVPVRFLAARLGVEIGDPPLGPPPVNPRAGLRFAIFLALHSDFVINPAIERFTRLLDDYRFAGLINAPFLASHLRQPSSELTDKQKSVLQVTCLGYLEFLQILGDLFIQLEPDEQPLYGCMYAYWLSHFFGLRRGKSGYERRGVAFQDLDPRAVLTATGDEDVSDVEQERLRVRVATLSEAWAVTRRLLESVAGN